MKAQSNYKSVLKSYISFLKQNKLYDKKKGFDQAWNFGPEPRNVKNVKKIVEDINITWNLKIKSILIKKKNFKEEQILKLNSNKAKKLLKWKPLLPYNETIKLTVDWYRKYLENLNVFIY